MATRINFLKDVIIGELQKQPFYYNLPPYSRILINKVIDDVSLKSSKNITSGVQTYSNKEINSSNQKIIGPFNPLNLINSNITSNQLTNRLLPGASQTILGGLANDLTFNLLKGVNDKLPPAFRNVIDLNSLTGIFSGIATTAVTKGLSTALSTFSQQTLSGNFKVNPLVPDISSLWSKNPTNAANEVNSKFDSAITKKALSEASSFNINNPNNTEKLRVNTVGFSDPTATYPTKEYKGQPDTNKLARGEVNGTIVQKKEEERVKSIQLPRGQFFEEPPQSFKGQYPYNKVNETESGHIIELDDTEGAERIHVFHKAGTYIEIDPNGSIVRRIKGSNYEIIDKNGYISVVGDCSISVKGSAKIYVGNDADIEVEGDVNVNCYNDITLQAAGKMNLSATEELNIHSGNVNIEADFNINMKADANVFFTSNNTYTKANNNIYTEVLKNNYLTVKESNYTNVTKQSHLKTGEGIYNQAGGAVHFKSTGTFNVDGSATYLQSGTAETSTAALTSQYAKGANVGLFGVSVDVALKPDGRPVRKAVVYDTIADPSSPNYIDALGEKGEDSVRSSDTKASRERLRSLGVVTDEMLDEQGVAIDKDSPKTSVTYVIRPSDELLRVTRLPDNYNLSKHFTLGMLSSKAVVSKYTVVAQQGLSYGQIVFNLAAIALNILEPIYALYPNMMVTSGFRTVGNGASNSQHFLGQAVDIQIPSIGPSNKNEYFNVAKKLATNINYDQFLLEYKTSGTGMPWIHISLNVDKNRNEVKTLLNDKVFAQGLAKVLV